MCGWAYYGVVTVEKQGVISIRLLVERNLYITYTNFS